MILRDKSKVQNLQKFQTNGRKVFLFLVSSFYQSTVELGDKELFWSPQNCSLVPNVPYHKHLTKVPYKVYLMKNQGKMAIFLESIILSTKNISLMDLFCNQS